MRKWGSKVAWDGNQSFPDTPDMLTFDTVSGVLSSASDTADVPAVLPAGRP